MASDNPSTVLLHGRDSDRFDGEADGTVTPGHLIDYNGTNADDDLTFVVHGTDDGEAGPRFAMEYAKTGRGIDADYSDGDHGEYYVALPGERIYAFVAAGPDLSTAANATVTAGDYLVSAGDGSLRAGGSAGNAVAQAVEAVDNSTASAGEQARLHVEVL